MEAFELETTESIEKVEEESAESTESSSKEQSAFSLKEPEGEEEAVARQKSKGEPKPQRLDLLDSLFTFVRQTEELNPVLCGYFTKLVNIFIMKRASEFNKYVF